MKSFSSKKTYINSIFVKFKKIYKIKIIFMKILISNFKKLMKSYICIIKENKK